MTHPIAFHAQRILESMTTQRPTSPGSSTPQSVVSTALWSLALVPLTQCQELFACLTTQRSFSIFENQSLLPLNSNPNQHPLFCFSGNLLVMLPVTKSCLDCNLSVSSRLPDKMIRMSSLLCAVMNQTHPKVSTHGNIL